MLVHLEKLMVEVCLSPLSNMGVNLIVWMPGYTYLAPLEYRMMTVNIKMGRVACSLY